MLDNRINLIGSNSPLQTATQGVQRGIARTAAAAQAVATAAAEPRDLTAALVESRVGRTEVAANARMLRTADQMLGTLLDVRA
jgi:hypothetical protein